MQRSNNFQFDYSVEISFVALSIVYALIGKIVWHSIAQNVSDKFIDIRLFMEGIIPALFLMGLSFVRKKILLIVFCWMLIATLQDNDVQM
jgi:hypothetical protein